MALRKLVILRQLSRLENLYSTASIRLDIEHQRYYSKLALLECAGWIEESMDLIVRRCVSIRRVRSRPVIDYIENLIEYNYGFDYKKNFKKILCQTIGVVEFNKIERSIDSITLSNFIGALTTLKTIRDTHAHTYILNTPAPFHSPSWVRSTFTNLYNGLVEFYNKV